MSHSVCFVILPVGTTDIASALATALAPFDENTQVEPYKEKCYCVGSKAKNDARVVANAKHGTIDSMRGAFHKRPETERIDEAWDELVAPFLATEKAAFEAHVQREAADIDCDDCKGSGQRTTTYNPRSKWDWYMVGGRWSGMLSGYDPAKDPANIETCDLCQGGGMRNDAVGLAARVAHPDYTSNGCNGEGKRVKWPTQWKKHGGDVTTCRAAFDGDELAEEKTPFAILTPEGEWYEQGRMGWWGMVRDEKEPADWRAHAAKILRHHVSYPVVVVDVHI